MIYLVLILSLTACAPYYQPTQTITLNSSIQHIDISSTNDKIVMASTNTLYIYTRNQHYQLSQQLDIPTNALELTQNDRLFVVSGDQAKLFVHFENEFDLSSPMGVGGDMDRINFGSINEEETIISLGNSSQIQIYQMKEDIRLVRNYYGSGIRYHSFTDDGSMLLIGRDDYIQLYSHFDFVIRLQTTGRVQLNGDSSFLLVPSHLQGNQTQLKIYQKISSNYTHIHSLIFEGTHLQSSITNNKKYLIFNSNHQLIIQPFSTNHSHQLINDTILLYRVSNDGQYLVTVGPDQIRIYINCNWNTTGGSFYNPSSAQCEACSFIGCQTCTQVGCDSCADGYWQISQDNILTCSKCPQSCLRCINNNECTECVDSHFFINGRCESCDIEGCKICENETVCGSCDTNYYKQGNICLSCAIKGCIECVSMDKCTTCDGGLNYALQDGRCALSGSNFDWQMALILSFLLSVFIGFVAYKLWPQSEEPYISDSTKPNIQQ